MSGLPIDPKKIWLFIAMPTGGTVDVATHISLSRTVSALREAGATVVTKAGMNGVVGRQREMLIAEALKTPCTHVLFHDSDVGWREETPIRLLAASVNPAFQFCAAICQQRRDNGDMCFMPTAHTDLKPHPITGFIEAEWVGFGMVLLTRFALEEMIAAYHDLAYHDEQDQPRHGLFMEMIENNRLLGEDYAFSRRWRKLGYSIWIDPMAKMLHAGRKEWIACAADYIARDKIATDKIATA